MHPLISVIVPVYNVEGYLENCIQSVLNQNYSNFELILVDDGSTDSSGSICDQFASKYQKIQVIHMKHTGSPSIPRNKGMQFAHGEWITFLDADDYIDNDMLSYLQNLCKTQNSDMALCGVRHIGFPFSIDREMTDNSYKVYSGVEAMRLILLGKAGFSGSASHALYKRSMINGLEFRNQRSYEDLEFVFHAAKRSNLVCCSAALKYNYVYRNNNSSSSGADSRFSDLDVICTALYAEVDKLGDDMVSALNQRYVSNGLAILERECLQDYQFWKTSSMTIGRKRILEMKLDEKSLSKTSRVEYISLKMGTFPFSITCQCVNRIKKGLKK